MNPLLKYLQKTGLSRRQFAALSGLDFSHVARITRGDRRPGLDAALAIEKATRGVVSVRAWKGVEA